MSRLEAASGSHPLFRTSTNALILALLLLLGRAALAAPTTQESIEQLNAPDPAQRDAAEKSLADRGKSAIPELRAAAHSPSPEIRLRARRALRRMALFRLSDVPDQQLAIADAYLNAESFDTRKLQLNQLLQCKEPGPEAVLTQLIPLEGDCELRKQMFYELGLGYRSQVARILCDDDDLEQLLMLLNGAGAMWGRQQAADQAVAALLTGHLDEQIAQCTAEQTNGDITEHEHAASQLCFLHRVRGNCDKALQFARNSGEQDLIFLVLQDQGNWAAAALEPVELWGPARGQAMRAAFQRLAGQTDQAAQSLSAVIASSTPDADTTLGSSKPLLLNDRPVEGMDLLLPNNPRAAFMLHAERGEFAKAIEIAERFPDADGVPEQLLKLRQDLGEVPEPATQPTQEEPEDAQAHQWQLALTDLQQKKFTAAADRFAAMWAADHTRFDRLYLQGFALKSAGQTALGESLMQKAQLLPLGDPLARWRLARQLDAAGLADVADQQRTLALRTGGSLDEWGFGVIWNTRCIEAMDRKDWAAAADALDRLCLLNQAAPYRWLDPTRYLTIPAMAHLAKAHLARQRGDRSGVLRELDLYQQYLPMSSELVIEGTALLNDIGEPARADALFNSVYAQLTNICQKHPHSRRYLNDLAWMSACCGRRLDDALTAAQAAVQLQPKDDQTLDTLAEVHFRRGERQAAIDIETRAAALSTDPYLQRQLTRFRTAAVPSTTQPGDEPR